MQLLRVNVRVRLYIYLNNKVQIYPLMNESLRQLERMNGWIKKKNN